MAIGDGIKALLQTVIQDVPLAFLGVVSPSYVRREPLSVHASPGLTTLLDVALYRSNEGGLTATACGATVALAAFLALKVQAAALLRSVLTDQHRGHDAQAAAGSGGGGGSGSGSGGGGGRRGHSEDDASDLAESFARHCLEAADEAIERITTERLAETANLDVEGRLASSDGKSPPPSAVASGGPVGGGGAASNSGGGSGGRDRGGGGSMRPTLIREGSGKGSAFWLEAAPAATGGRASNRQPRRRDCWESARLCCPDYVWADDAITHCQRLVRNLAKHRFVAASANRGLVDSYGNVVSGGGTGLASGGDWGSGSLSSPTAQAAETVVCLIREDLPTKLHHFRSAVESDAVVSKRLYLVKCEYRAPFRAFLEAHQSVQRAPRLEMVDAYLALHRKSDKEALYRRKKAAEKAVQGALEHPKLVEALRLEQQCELMEVGMARMLLPFTELARYLDNRKARLRLIPGVLTAEDLPGLEELLRRLKPMLCRKSGTELRTGIRPLLLDLQGFPRDVTLASTEIFPFGTYPKLSEEKAFHRRLEVFLSQLQCLTDVCATKDGIYLEKSGSDVPASITKGLAALDSEMFHAQYEDWFGTVTEQRRLERAPGPSFELLSEIIQRAEIEASIAIAPRPQLDMVRQRLELFEKDRMKRFDVLQEMVQEVCLREMAMEIVLTPPGKDLVLELPEMSALGLFGEQLQMAGEPLPLG